MEIAYTDTGSGVPLVLLHAFPLSAAMWAGQRDALAGTCRLILPDQRGFGASVPVGTDPPDLDLAADDLRELLDRLRLDQVALGGLSMGGYVAMAFLRRYPERVSALILADTKASPDAPEAAENRHRIAAAVQQAGDSELLVTEMLPKLLGATTRERRPELVDAVTRMVRSAPPDAVAWAQRAMAARPASFDTIAAFTGPALVIVGEEDALAPVTEAAAMVSALPTATLVRIPAAGHLTALETPDEVSTAIRDFLAT